MLLNTPHKLYWKGTVETETEKNAIWNALKTIPTWQTDIVADIQVTGVPAAHAATTAPAPRAYTATRAGGSQALRVPATSTRRIRNRRADVTTAEYGGRFEGEPTNMSISLVGRAGAALLLASGVAASSYLSGSLQAKDKDHAASPRHAIQITPLGTYATGQFDEAAAEIAAYDPKTQRVFVVNAQSGEVDVLDVSNPSTPTRLFTIAVNGVANSVAVHDGLVAVAVEAVPKTNPGHVVFMNTEGATRATVTVGALPDMLTFTRDGRRVLVANEGEPSEDYTIDPEGSVSIIELPRQLSRLGQEHVRTVRFNVNAAKLDPRIRIFGPGATVATNLEPEYIALSKDGRTAWVTLQEANAVAIIDVDSAKLLEIRSLGFKDHMLPGNELDVSDQGAGVRIGNWPVLGMFQPDGVATYEHKGKTYLVTANEGDTRDWPGYTEISRFRALSGTVPPCADSPRLQKFFATNPFGIATLTELRDNANMGRLNVTTATGLRADGSCYQDLYTFGARSFSIWSEGLKLVFDSGSAFEQIVQKALPANFNSNHTEDNFKGRSDDKGPEPEGVTVAELWGRVYAFIGLERVSGVMIYDITDPYRPFFVQYFNNRTFFPAGTTPAPTLDQRGDLGPEGLLVIKPKDSPIPGSALLVVANEVSGTTTTYRIDRERLANRPRGSKHDRDDD